jgi:hypothetical protein
VFKTSETSVKGVECRECAAGGKKVQQLLRRADAQEETKKKKTYFMRSLSASTALVVLRLLSSRTLTPFFPTDLMPLAVAAREEGGGRERAR